MTRQRPLARLLLAGLTAVAALAPLSAHAQETKIKMVLNWKYEGPQAWFFIAQDKGYFKAEGLDVEIDQGAGSAASIPKVASGAYQAGFGDINAVIDLAAKRPSEAPVGVYMLYNTPPFTVVVKSDSPIRTPKDLEGKTVGGPATDAALKLFPGSPSWPTSTPARSTSPTWPPTCVSRCWRAARWTPPSAT